MKALRHPVLLWLLVGSFSVSLLFVLKSTPSAAEGEIDFGKLKDVGIRLDIAFQNSTFNRRTSELSVDAVVTNISADEVTPPLLFVVDSFSVAGVSLVNADGTTPDGKPYVNLSFLVGSDGVLSPGESTAPTTLVFKNNSRSRFTFESTCLGVIVLGPPPAPVLDTHSKLTSESTVTITGKALDAAEVQVSSPQGVFIVPVTDSQFVAEVPLVANGINQIFFTSITAEGLKSAPSTTKVTRDTQPPNLQIQFPQDGAEVTTDITDVAGFVGDPLSGFEGLTVDVNGSAAIVDIGIGTNGTFFLESLPLTLGENVITASASDILGNEVSKQIAVTKVEIPPDAPKIVAVSGNGQKSQVDTLLPEPVVVQVTHADGSPFAGKIVAFEVTRSNGRLSADGQGEGSLKFQTKTDSNGTAQAFWQLGTDAGCGNNRVEVTSKDIVGTTAFCASATPAPPGQINVGTGNNQRGEVASPAVEPLVAWVSDGCNGVADIPVTFIVQKGGGQVDGEKVTTVNTSATGHAEVNFTFGPQGGSNRVIATFAGNPGQPAVFTGVGLVRDEEKPTSLSGVVLDNASNPIGGAECVVTVNGIALPSVLSDAEGKFSFSDIPDGAAHLHVDGTVANQLNGSSIPQGSFPALTYDLLIVPNAENSLPTPVLLPALNPNNAVPFDNSADVELTVEEIDGLKMIVKAGSMTRADGTVPSPGDPAVLSLNQVHHDDVPMPMPDGAAPPFAWTLQPAGAHFDPPVEIHYPNMSGLPAGTIAYFLSFNHDTMQFEIVAPGQVSDDGSAIVSDPETGISVSGWGCNCPPYSVTADCENCSEECTENGELTGGEITVSPSSKEVKEGETLTFTVGSISDSGGEKKETCEDGSMSTSSVSPTSASIEWTITKPDGTSVTGSGSTASITPDICGTYNFSYTATADRDCAPSSISKSESGRRVLEDFGPEVKIEFPLPDAVDNALQSLGSFLGLTDPSVSADVAIKSRDCCDEMNQVIDEGEAEGSGNLTISASTQGVAVKVPTPGGLIPLGIVVDETLSFPIVGAVAKIKLEAGLIAKGNVKFTGQGGKRENLCFPDDDSLNCVFANVGAGVGVSVEATISAEVCDVDGGDCDGFDIDFAKASASLSGKIGYDGCKSPPIDIGVSIGGSVSAGLKITIAGKTFGPEVSKGFGPVQLLPL